MPSGADTPIRNQTNLALKGIIGIAAMATIANLTGNTDDASNYSSIADNYITQWQTLGIAMDADPPHTTLAYGMNDTYSELSSSESPVNVSELLSMKICCTISMAIKNSILDWSPKRYMTCKVISTQPSSRSMECHLTQELTMQTVGTFFT